MITGKTISRSYNILRANSFDIKTILELKILNYLIEKLEKWHEQTHEHKTKHQCSTNIRSVHIIQHIDDAL